MKCSPRPSDPNRCSVTTHCPKIEIAQSCNNIWVRHHPKSICIVGPVVICLTFAPGPMWNLWWDLVTFIVFVCLLTLWKSECHLLVFSQCQLMLGRTLKGLVDVSSLPTPSAPNGLLHSVSIHWEACFQEDFYLQFEYIYPEPLL